MVLLNTLAPIALVLALLWVQRRMEDWLQQHIFKVGWLVTKDLRTTTLVYYLIFLPGVVLHEVTLWLTAGLLNVRADRAIAWPEAQSAAELKLTFVKVAKNAPALKLAVIHTAPLAVGVGFIYVIANNILNVDSFIALVQSGALPLDFAIGQLIGAPDFFLWLYLIFTLGSTMWPDVKMLKGWRIVIIIAIIVVAALYLLGIGDAVLANGLAAPLARAINILSLAVGVVIAIHGFFTAVLGLIEAGIERVTGDSATFQNGKLVAITRAERLKQEAEARTKLEKQRQQQTERAASRGVLAGPPSIYRLPLPIPGGPGKETTLLDGVLVAKDNTPLPDDARAGVGIITGTVVTKPTLLAGQPPPADAAEARPERETLSPRAAPSPPAQ